MPAPTPPRPRRAKAPLGAAQRRRTQSTLTPGSQVTRGTTTPKPPAVQPGPVIKQERQPTTTPGSGRSRVNPNLVQHATGSVMNPAETARSGKKFQVKYLGNGRIAHIYGNDVPADQRRQVFKRAAKRRAA